MFNRRAFGLGYKVYVKLQNAFVHLLKSSPGLVRCLNRTRSFKALFRKISQCTKFNAIAVACNKLQFTWKDLCVFKASIEYSPMSSVIQNILFCIVIHWWCHWTNNSPVGGRKVMFWFVLFFCGKNNYMPNAVFVFAFCKPLSSVVPFLLALMLSLHQSHKPLITTVMQSNKT